MSNRGRHRKSNKHLIIQILGSTMANRMMECQKEQGNIPNLDVFLNNPNASKYAGGFTWGFTKEGHKFWLTTMYNALEEHHLYKKYKNDRR
jgi:hypothetical protein